MDIWKQRVTPADEVLHQELAGETVLLHLKTEHYFGLDPVGTRIWQVLGETGSAEAVVARLLTEYDVDESRLRADVERLLGELIAGHLVKVEAVNASA